MRKILLVALMALTAGLVSAQAAAPSAFTITWIPPTQFVDGTILTGAVTYQMYVGVTGKEVAYKTPVTSPPYVLVPTPAAGTSTCVQVTATVNGVESARSAEVCATVPFTAPNIPTAVAVTVH